MHRHSTSRAHPGHGRLKMVLYPIFLIINPIHGDRSGSGNLTLIGGPKVQIRHPHKAQISLEMLIRNLQQSLEEIWHCFYRATGGIAQGGADADGFLITFGKKVRRCFEVRGTIHFGIPHSGSEGESPLSYDREKTIKTGSWER